MTLQNEIEKIIEKHETFIETFEQVSRGDMKVTSSSIGKDKDGSTN